MRIVIRPSKESNPNHSIGDEITKALELLRAASILPEGGGTVGLNGDAYGVILLRREEDIPNAIEALVRAGIRASEA